LKTKKQNQTEPKPKKSEKNRVKLEKPSQTGLNRLLFGFGFFKKNWFDYFFYKNRTEQKIITRTCKHGELWIELCFVLLIILKLFGSLIYIL
jgi:hypothetical protein